MNKLSRRIVFNFLFVTWATVTYGQTPFKFVQDPMLSQNSKVATNISHFTGRLSLSVPIYAYKSSFSNLNMSVSLDYSGGGLNINQNPSSVGAGWTLNAGGAIYRTINGLPDDLYSSVNPNCHKGFFYATTTIPDNPCPLAYQGPGSYQSSDNKICQDSELDNYYFNAGGKQGELLIPQNILSTGSMVDIKTIPQTSFKTSLSQPGLPSNVTTTIGEIIMVNDLGIEYHFGAVETMQKSTNSLVHDGGSSYHYSYTYHDEYYVTAWKITKMVDLNTGEEINFTYEDYSVSFKRPNTSSTYRDQNTLAIFFYNDNDAMYKGNYKRLKSISFGNKDLISFVYDYTKQRKDFASDRALIQVKIQNQAAGTQMVFNMKQVYYYKKLLSGSNYETGELAYSNAISSGQDDHNSWLFLQGVSQQGTDGVSEIPIAKFNYTHFIRNETDGRFQVNPISVPKRFTGNYWGYTTTEVQNMFGQIDTVFNPRGGYTAYKYEQNSYQANGANTTASGLRLMQATEHDGIDHGNDIVINYAYETTDLNTSGFMPAKAPEVYYNSLRQTNGALSNYSIQSDPVLPPTLLKGNPVGYSRVIESSPVNGKTVYEFTSLTDYPPLYTSLFYPFPNKPQIAEWAYGLPKTIAVFDKNNAELKRTVNTFSVVISPLSQPIYRSMKMAYQTEAAGPVLGWSGNMNTDCQNAVTNFQFTKEFYYPVTGIVQLTSQKVTDYFASGEMSRTESYEYDPVYYNVKKLSTLNAKGQAYEKNFFYPYEYATGSPNFLLTYYNIVSQPTSSLTTLTKSGSKYIIQYDKTDFQILPGSIAVPHKTYSLGTSEPIALPAATILGPEVNYGVATAKLSNIETFDDYDTEGKFLQAKSRSGFQGVVWDEESKSIIAKVKGAKGSDVFFTSFENRAGWDGYAGYGDVPISAYDQNMVHCGRIAGRIDNNGPSERYSHSNKTLRVSLAAPTKFIYSGWVYSNGPSVEIYLFMKRDGEQGYNSYHDHVATSVINQWVYLQKEFTIPQDVTQIGIRLDNNSAGQVWFDDVRISPATAIMNTFTFAPLVGLTSETDQNNQSIHYEYDKFGRLSVVRDNDKNIIKRYCYGINGQSDDCSLFENSDKSGYYYSQWCGWGETPLPYYVSVPSGMFTSTASATDANDQATLYAQQMANQNGQCQAPDVTLYFNNYPNAYGYTVQLTNTVTSDSYWFQIDYNSGILGSVPSGTYDIQFFSCCDGSYRSFYAGCYYGTSGWGGAAMYNIPINQSCNNIEISY